MYVCSVCISFLHRQLYYGLIGSFSFLSGLSAFYFLVSDLLNWWKLPALCQKGPMRTDILVLFPVWAGRRPAFTSEHDITSQAFVDVFHQVAEILLVAVFLVGKIVNGFRICRFYCVCWCDNLTFLLPVDVIHYFLEWNKSHLVMVCLALFPNVLRTSVNRFMRAREACSFPLCSLSDSSTSA